MLELYLHQRMASLIFPLKVFDDHIAMITVDPAWRLGCRLTDALQLAQNEMGHHRQIQLVSLTERDPMHIFKLRARRRRRVIEQCR